MVMERGMVYGGDGDGGSYILFLPPPPLPLPQAKFMPYSNDSIIVTAARDGQIMCDTISTTGTLLHSKRVGSHNDSAHKVT